MAQAGVVVSHKYFMKYFWLWRRIIDPSLNVVIQYWIISVAEINPGKQSVNTEWRERQMKQVNI